MNKQEKQKWHIHVVEYYLAIKKEEKVDNCDNMDELRVL